MAHASRGLGPPGGTRSGGPAPCGHPQHGVRARRASRGPAAASLGRRGRGTLRWRPPRCPATHSSTQRQQWSHTWPRQAAPGAAPLWGTRGRTSGWQPSPAALVPGRPVCGVRNGTPGCAAPSPAGDRAAVAGRGGWCAASPLPPGCRARGLRGLRGLSPRPPAADTAADPASWHPWWGYWARPPGLANRRGCRQQQRWQQQFGGSGGCGHGSGSLGPGTRPPPRASASGRCQPQPLQQHLRPHPNCEP
jgi:hypothetical protein